MPTPGEKKALFFLSLTAVLGSVARLVAANAVPVPTPAELRALEAQIQVVDSVRRGRRAGGGGRRKSPRPSAKRPADSAANTAQSSPPSAQRAPARPPPAPVDIDIAPAAELESLPGIGPTLARRIVAARDSSGHFGSLDALQSRVRGVGPALAKRLAPAVTFSGAHSPPSAERTEPFGNGATTARATRRRGH